MMFPLYLKRSDDDEKPTDPIAYIVGKNGAFLHKVTAIFRATVKADKLPMLAEIKEEAEYLLPPMPAELVAQILFFFRAIYDRDKSEAIILIAYNPDTAEFGLVAPEQKATGAHVSYTMPQSAPAGFRFIGTIHSHGNMSAFHSGTDTHDEAHFDGIHLTVGHVDRARVAVVAALAVNGRRQTQPPERILGGLRFEKWVPKPWTMEPAKPVEPPEPPEEEKGEKEEGGFPTLASIIDFFAQGLSRRQLRKLKHELSIKERRKELDAREKERKAAPTVYRSVGGPGWQSWDEGFVLDLPDDVTWEEILPPSEWNARVEKPQARVYTYTRTLGYGDEMGDHVVGDRPIGFHVQGPRPAAYQSHLGPHQSSYYGNQDRASSPRHITPVPAAAAVATGHNPYTSDSGETSVPIEIVAPREAKDVPAIVTTDYEWGDREGGES